MPEVRLTIEEVAVYTNTGELIPGLAAYQVKVTDTSTGETKVLDSHWQEDVAFKCLLRWCKRYAALGYQKVTGF